ncbi:hypothetical protein ACI2K4_24530 [Micromonospora sp. NPDC050397]|uniref:hypothetical protein n=1 Tax=Micromonospora sp. NPDC050397 TaxID=3364279 RepID=UPI00384C8B1D
MSGRLGNVDRAPPAARPDPAHRDGRRPAAARRGGARAGRRYAKLGVLLASLVSAALATVVLRARNRHYRRLRTDNAEV